MYVALSRVISLNGLYLTGEYNSSVIKADLRATIEHDDMRKNHVMRPIDTCSTVSSSSLTPTLLNTRSLMKHAVDIAANEVIKESNIIFLTETQVESTTDIASISDILDEFIVLRNISTDKFCSLACCYKNTINNNQQQNDIPAVTLYSMQMETFQHSGLNILQLYRKNMSKIDDVTYLIDHFLSRTEDSKYQHNIR